MEKIAGHKFVNSPRRNSKYLSWKTGLFKTGMDQSAAKNANVSPFLTITVMGELLNSYQSNVVVVLSRSVADLINKNFNRLDFIVAKTHQLL